jgi:hypothetical protein
VCDFFEHAWTLLSQDRPAEHDEVNLSSGRLRDRFRDGRDLVRFVLVVKHELDSRARYFVAVDHEDALILDGPRDLDTYLHA